MEIDIEEDENKPELTYTYEEVDPLIPLPPAFESEPDDEIEVENPVEHEDETVPASVHETVHALVKKKGKEKDKFYGKLILELGNEVRSSVEQGTVAMEKLVEKLGNTEDKVECKKLKKELEEARFSNTFLRMQNERVEKDLYWTRVRAHEFYQEMIHSENLLEIHSSLDSIVDSVDAAIAAERARQVNVRNDASGSGPVRGAVELRRWFEKTKSVFEISECAEGKKVKFAATILKGLALTWWKTKVATMGLKTVNQMPWTEMKLLMTAEFCPIEEVQRMEHELMVEPERVKVDAYIRGLTDNIKGEVISSKPADLNKAVHMAHKLMEQKLQCKDFRRKEVKVGEPSRCK
nr:hypothetical protein [Tanacetum cinerariifolium]